MCKVNLRSSVSVSGSGCQLVACSSCTTEGCLALQVLVRSKFALSPRQLFSACLEVCPESVSTPKSMLSQMPVNSNECSYLKCTAVSCFGR